MVYIAVAPRDPNLDSILLGNVSTYSQRTQS